MITIIKNIVLVSFLSLILSCDDPAPIEIINEEEEVEIDVINPEPNSFVITGYDSTGITSETPEKESVITFSGIKNTINSVTYYKGYSEAVFFDTTKAVRTLSNRLIGYKTLDFGSVKFGNQTAVIEPYILKYRENNITKDTILGVKHARLYQRVLSPGQLNFPYDRNVNIEFINQQGNSSLMTIRLPDEIIGNIGLSGSRGNGNLKITLTWSNTQMNQNSVSGKLSEEIIVGGIDESRDEIVPLFRLRRFNSRRFVVPNSLVEDVLSGGGYDFIRKIRKSNTTSRLGDVYFASQSIHNIWIKI